MLKTIKNVKISAIATCVPQKQVDIYDNKLIYGGNLKKLNKVVAGTGFHKRHILEENSDLTTADLSIKAAEALFDAGIKKEEIKAIVFVSQMPDYFEPATACVIQGKLGLSEECIAFDVNQGCAGYIYGLLIASSLVDEESKKVLLLAGDTTTRMIGSQLNIVDDIPIFGDGGCATILEYDENSTPMFFDIGAQGESYQAIMTKNGGYKNQPTKDMFDENGKFMYGNQMDGLKVFDFTMNIVPPSINKAMQLKGFKDEDVDYYILHQANKMILENIAAGAKINVDKVLRETIKNYGNLSSASISSVLCDEYEKFNNKENKVVMSGFGVGLSWGSVALDLNNPLILPIIYY